MPRLQALTGRRWVGLLACSLVLSLQHVTLPLVLEWRFVSYRALMFLPFALFVGWLLDRRRALLPHMMVFHGLIDASVGVMVLMNCNQDEARAPKAARSLDLRLYGIGAQILRDLGVGKMRLMAAPRKMPSMAGFGLEVTSYADMPRR